jgi:hypothetical protein
MGTRLTLSFSDVRALEKEMERRLSRNEATVPGARGLAPFTPCELEIQHPHGGEPITVQATVMTSPEEQEREGCVRLMLDEGVGASLREFVARERTDAGETDDANALADDEADDAASAAMPLPLRLRQLTIPAQLKLARTSQSLSERTALERILSKTGWEELLGNPYITVPEVARIARKGTAPRVLLERILLNQLWTRTPIVRRALLSNPKLTGEMIETVLRLAPVHELKLVLKQTAYPALVRTVAERLMGRA